LDQPDRADLNEILELLAAVRVPPCERADERHVAFDQLLASRDVAALVVLPEELSVALLLQHQAVRRFSRVTQAPPSPFVTRVPSRPVPSTRRSPTSPARSAAGSLRGPAGSGGPTPVTSRSSSTRTVSVTSEPPPTRSRRLSTASRRSSSPSTVRESRDPSPPRTRCATG